MKRCFRTAAMLLLAGSAAGVTAEPTTTPTAPEGVDPAMHERAFRMIQMQTFYSLPESHRAEILEEAERQGIELPMTADDLVESDPSIAARDMPLSAEELDEAFSKVSHVVDRATFEGFRPIHQRMLASFAEVAKTHDVPVKPCFAPGTDPAVVQAFEDIVFGDFSRFQLTSRWQGTALNPGGASQGDPTILTYSFPADGVTVPNGVGEGTGPNNLNAFLDGIYGGNRALWRGYYDEIFARWAELSGNTYILEPNDDNVTLFNSAGVAGVRGDLRMAGKTIDGNSGILAYNFFPQNGDMVIDTADNFYATTSNNSLRLRNILAHEHGHGMGLLHVCPLGSILMNPFINLAFDGPQYDDVLGAQRQYGDALEPNDTLAQATDLGTLTGGDTVNFGGAGGVGPSTTDWISIDDNGDTDLFRLQISGTVSINATATPIGFTYQDGPQTQSCNSGPTVNPQNYGDLQIDILNSGGGVIASVNDNGLGGAESIVANASSGTFFVRVRNTGQNQIQAYRLDISIEGPAIIPLTLTNEGPVPSVIAPGDGTQQLSVRVTLNDDTLLSGPTLNFRRAGEAGFTAIPFGTPAGDVYTVTIPDSLCDEDPDFFVSVTGQEAGGLTLPTSGQYTALIGEATTFSDSGNGGIAFAVGGNITTAEAGRWQAGAPQGNDRDDPAVDFDGNGLAWLTGISASTTNSDVDGGSTILTSPVFDLSGGGSISYAYWMSDAVNPIGPEDGFVVEVSTNGGSSFFPVRDYNSQPGSWRTDTLVADVDFPAASNVAFRFVATDADPGNVLECGVDAIEVISLTCENPVGCNNPADVNGNGEVDPGDFTAWVAAYNANDIAADQNGNGVVDSGDFTAWVNNYNIGC
ncbi:MAG: matrixin family metalloprotease [Phycisphaerales bacterium]